MVVEDDADTRELLRDILEPIGYRLIQAVNGEAALRQLATEIPDVIILDSRLGGGMSGEDFIHAIRHDRVLRSIPRILQTGDYASVKRACAMGERVLFKPYDIQLLVLVVAACCRRAPESRSRQRRA